MSGYRPTPSFEFEKYKNLCTIYLSVLIYKQIILKERLSIKDNNHKFNHLFLQGCVCKKIIDSINLYVVRVLKSETRQWAASKV